MTVSRNFGSAVRVSETIWVRGARQLPSCSSRGRASASCRSRSRVATCVLRRLRGRYGARRRFSIEHASGKLGRTGDLVVATGENLDGEPDARGVDNGLGERPG
jgi:hypothetical protein